MSVAEILLALSLLAALGLIVAGVALLSPAFALIVAGLGLGFFGVGMFVEVGD